MKRKIPITLVSGFLGSGKTTLIGEILSRYTPQLKIAIIQNEFAASGIDGYILRKENSAFTLRELNTGSIFCSCLFSQFKEAIIELTQNDAFDLVIVEATGIADPIGIAQLFEDEAVNQHCYLSRILTVVDAARFLRGISKIVGARHQVQVADMVLISKVDLTDNETVRQVAREIREINPLAEVSIGISADNILAAPLSNLISQGVNGELTRCGEGGYQSKIFKTTKAVTRANLDKFLDSLDDDILRLKGFVIDPHGESYMIQYQPGQCEVIPIKGAIIGNTELISIGYREPNFNLLQANTFTWCGAV